MSVGMEQLQWLAVVRHGQSTGNVTAEAAEVNGLEAIDIPERDADVPLSETVRRLPVIDGHQLVGIVAVADVARALPDRPVGDLIDALSE